MTTSFSALLAAVVGDNELELDVPPDWMQGRSVFGGLQAALALRAMRARVTTPLRTLQVTFIAPVAERMLASSTVLRSGASATHVEARIFDAAGKLGAIAIGVFGAPRSSVVAIEPVQPVIAPRMSVELPYIAGRVPAFIQHFQARWLVGALPFSGRKERAHVIEIGMHDALATEAHVVALADFVPPLALSFLETPANGSTVTWMLELLTDRFDQPPRGWRIDAELIAARDGYTNQTVMLWAPDGTPVALSRQSMMVFG